MLTGKIEVAHERSQSGGYRYFLIAVARQLQRHVRAQAESLDSGEWHEHPG